MDVLGLHGIAQEQLGRNQLIDDWRRGLADGVEIAGGRAAAVPSFDVSYYGNLFLPPGAEGVLAAGQGKGGPAAAWVAAPVDDVDVEFLSEAVDELERTTPELPAAMGAPAVPAVLRPLAQRLTRRVSGGLALRFIAVLRQVARYLDDDDLAERIRARFLIDLQHGPRVVIAHSLGTVVAFDTMELNPAQQAPTLITLGSPLGMRAVTSRLRRADGTRGLPGQPANIGRWVNVFDPGDPVAAAGGLARLWPAVTDYTVGNGDDPHDIRRYLGKRITGATVISGITG